MKWKKSLAILLFLILLLCSCQAGTKGNNSVSEDENVDLGGYEFVIMSPFLSGLIKDSQSPNDPFLEAVDKRRQEIEKKYNCKITGERDYAGISFLQPLILSGDKVADVIDMMAPQWLPAAAMGYLKPWDEVEGFDVNASQFDKEYTQLGTFKGHVYGINYVKPPVIRACMYYNKTLLKELNLTDPNVLMDQNKWDFEEFRKLCIAATKDTNGDNSPDIWGLNYYYNYQSASYFVEANGGSIAKLSGDKVVTNFTDQKTVEAVQFLYNLTQVDKVVQMHPDDLPDNKLAAKSADYYVQDFVNGNSLFLIGDGWMATQYFSDMEDEYGLLPIPMGPSATEYVSSAANADVFVLTSTNKDLDKTAFIWNKFTAPLEGYGENWWVEDLSELYDDRSIENYKLILKSSRVDLGNGSPTLLNAFYEMVKGSVFKNEFTVSAGIDAMSGLYQDVLDGIYNNAEKVVK